MIVNPDFNFEVSLSKESFANKVIANAMIGRSTDEKNTATRKEYGFIRGVSYERVTVTPSTLLTSLTQGKCACQLFSPKRPRKDGTFGTTDKRYENFVGAYCVFVDVDETKYKDMRAFIDELSLKPTFAYTSYSNQQPGKRARFRLCYVFGKPVKGIFHFRYLAHKVYEKIELDTKETIKDKCGLSPAQYMNGTNKSAKNIIFDEFFTGSIFDYPDFSCSDEDFVSYLQRYCDYSVSQIRRYKRDIDSLLYSLCNDKERKTWDISKIKTQAITTDKKIDTCCKFSERFVCDMERLSYDDFMQEYRHTIEYFWRKEDNKAWTLILTDYGYIEYQDVPEGYFSLPYYRNKIKDGQGRRKKLYQRMCLRRVMRPDVFADDLLFNAYEDLHRLMDNSGKDGANIITVEELQRNVEDAMRLSVEEIETDYKDMIGYLRSRKPKGGKIYRFGRATTTGERNRAIKAVRWREIADNYEWTLTPQENLENLQAMGIEVGIATIYRYCKEHDIPTHAGKLYKDALVMKMYDETLSLRANHKKLKEQGIKISLEKLRKLRGTHT